MCHTINISFYLKKALPSSVPPSDEEAFPSKCADVDDAPCSATADPEPDAAPRGVTDVDRDVVAVLAAPAPIAGPLLAFVAVSILLTSACRLPHYFPNVNNFKISN